MKKVLLTVFVFSFSIVAFAQMDSTAPYYKNRTLPSFRLLSVDSVAFNQSVLDDNKRTIIMMFHPECDHCQHQLELLLSMPEVTESTQIVMVSGETVEKNKIFYDKYELQKYPFIHLGRDFTRFFLGFYKPGTVPVLVFYNKKKEFTLIHQGNADKKEILQALNK